MVEITIDGQKRRVSGRIERIVRWLVSNLEAVTLPDKVHIGFDCAGPVLSVETKVREMVP